MNAISYSFAAYFLFHFIPRPCGFVKIGMINICSVLGHRLKWPLSKHVKSIKLQKQL